MVRRFVVIGAGIVVVAGAITWYIVGFLTVSPPAFTVPSTPGAVPTAEMTLQTVGSLGSGWSQPGWVSYLIKGTDGKWVHTTIYTLPAHALVHVTVYQFDSATGLRNPYFARPQGVVGNTIKLDGKTVDVINPNLTSHTFVVSGLHLIVPLPGVADNATNTCSQAPCSLALAHRTIQFSFRTGAPGQYRWQCFVPCAAGFIFGLGGPMQTIGYMDGFLNVV